MVWLLSDSGASPSALVSVNLNHAIAATRRILIGVFMIICATHSWEGFRFGNWGVGLRFAAV